MGENNAVVFIYLNVSKVFDTVTLGKLLSSLEGMGVSGTIIILVRSYLRRRVQQVMLKEELLGYKEIVKGLDDSLFRVLCVQFWSPMLKKKRLI